MAFTSRAVIQLRTYKLPHAVEVWIKTQSYGKSRDCVAVGFDIREIELDEWKPMVLVQSNKFAVVPCPQPVCLLRGHLVARGK